ncbi:fimbria/pilus periplasmic chaperone [Proteus mirabilis]|uniref:fimbrial biogenesis chaperone n=1 Tax=Proteus mirabilis TaxID=584 RepID=UPI001E3B6081|nr:fimbria/pilus periplasmic chaperone [Proteus mirabilis]MCD4628866.1 fimbria/pilus periplasmic chaperone [Proteus mirabilis]
MKYNVYILFIIILCSTFFTQANVIYSGTRFIYNEDDNDIIINIKNKNSATDYLIQSWITKDENDKNTPFMITPPLKQYYYLMIVKSEILNHISYILYLQHNSL